MENDQKWKQGYLEKRPAAGGPAWFLRYWEKGDGGKLTRKRLRVGLVADYPSRAAATKAARHLRDRINDPLNDDSAKRRTFGDVIARYLLEEVPERHSTQRNYKRMLRLYIQPTWGSAPLHIVKAAPVREWLRELTLSPKSKKDIHGLMKTLFRLAMLWEWYPQIENPMNLFFIKDGSKRLKEPRVLTPDEFSRVMNALPGEPYRTMVITAMCLGLRCSELFALKWEDIDFHAGVIHIRRAIVEGYVAETKTRASRASLPLDERLAKIFLGYRPHAICKQESDWVFAGPMTAGKKPMLPNNVQYNILRKAGCEAGLDFSLGWHTLRHTYKSWMDRVGAQSIVKRDLMRHADIRTTEQVYGEVKMDQLREVNEKIVSLVRIQ